MGSSKKPKVTRYFMGIHMGLGRGPIDELVEIRVGDRRAWFGSATYSTTITINKPDLFGGLKREGGIDGLLRVMMGEPDQQPEQSPYFRRVLGDSLVPAFRGVCTLVYNGLVSVSNPYPKPWKFRVRRALKGWQDDQVWYPDKCRVDLSSSAGHAIHAMNPAHILVQCLTDRSWGRGLPMERLDLDSYTSAADQLFAEGFGLCLKWSRQDSLERFMQSVLDHIGGGQFVSRRTGLVTLRLIRDDYDPQTLPVFGFSTGLLAIEEETLAVGETIPNEIVVTWRSPVDNKERQVRQQNLGAIQASGAVFSQTNDYPGLPTAELASRVAARDLRAGYGIKRYKLRFDRRAHKLEPASVFRISAPELGIEDLVLRVGRIDYGRLTDGTIEVTAVQDVFALPDAVYTQEQESTWEPPNTTPQPVVDQRLMEVPYRDLALQLSQVERDALEADAGFIAALGVRPNGMSIDYWLATRTGTADYAQVAEGDWSPTGLLEDDLLRGQTTATLSAGIDLGLVELGTAALIGDELVRVDAIDPDTGAVTLARGCADTIPSDHPQGARVWLYEGYPTADPSEYVYGEQVYGKLLTRTTEGELAEAQAPASTIDLASRQARPYPPANVQINGAYWPQTITGPLSITWAHRSRLIQADVLVPWTDGDIGPETGTTYTLELYDEAGNLVRTETGITANNYTWSDEVADSGLGRLNGHVRVVLWAVRDGLDSWQVFDHTTDRAGYGLQYGNYYGGL